MASHSCTSTTQRWATLTAVEADAPGVKQHRRRMSPPPALTGSPGLAEAVGAKPPRSVPTFIARVVRGEAWRIADDAGTWYRDGQARRELGRQPRYPSYRESFRAGMPDLPAARRAAPN